MGTGITDVVGGPRDFCPLGPMNFKNSGTRREPGNVSIIKMWSFVKHYNGAQPGKRKTPAEKMIERLHRKIELEIERV
jgi:hypothetical protein